VARPWDPLGTLSADVAATAALSPLAEIEAQVQARAKDLNLDLGTVPDRAVLGQLVERAIADWEAEHKRGLRPLSLADPALVADRVLRNLAGYGPLEPLLADDDVWEVMVNAPDGTFAESRVSNSRVGRCRRSGCARGRDDNDAVDEPQSCRRSRAGWTARPSPRPACSR
jgi:hypothetical protein